MSTEGSDGERAAALATAAVLIGRFSDCMHHWSQSWAPLVEARLEARAREAQEELDLYRASRALHLALDCVLPGWVYIEYPDRVLRAQHRAPFVSNRQEEWVQHLVDVGMEPDRARKLTDAAFASAAAARARASRSPRGE